MTQPRLPTRRDQRGFTLIELLVVIIILGILSAVVVFAVKGTNDKGTSAAIATDRRTLRTAMETFCAKNGTYPTDPDVPPEATPYDAMDVLVDQNFLSNRSEHYGLATGMKDPLDPDAFPEGNCAGMGYKLIGPGDGGTQSHPTTACKKIVAGEERLAEVTATMLDQGYWCLASRQLRPRDPSSNGPGAWRHGTTYKPNLVQLRDGRVLSMQWPVTVPADEAENVLGVPTTTGLATELFDPAPPDGDPKGKWAHGPPALLRAIDTPAGRTPIDGNFQGLVLIDGVNGSDDPCGQRCGQVFAHFGTHAKLYHPGDNRWTVIEPNFVRGGAPGGDEVAMIQARGPNCGAHCGKIVIATTADDRIVQLYDPKSNEFELLSQFQFDPKTQSDGRPWLTELLDGRVLMRTSFFGSGGAAYLMDVSTGISQKMVYRVKFTFDPGPPIMLPGPSGRVLYLNQSSVGEIYTPEPPSGEGTWAVLRPPGSATGDGDTCTDEDPSFFCEARAKLPDGKVLVHRRKSVAPSDDNPLINTFMLFDSERLRGSQWTDTGSLNDLLTGRNADVVLLTRGNCGVNCNSVLMTSPYGNAELYRPGSAPFGAG